MADIFSPEKRSSIMSKIRGKNTGPEIKVRRLIFSMGYRYRLHRKDLPGCPDIVFPGRKKVIFVHGCFWHAHKNCKASALPETRKEFWENKISANQERDNGNIKKLENLGWKILIIWQCEVKNISSITEKINTFLLT